MTVAMRAVLGEEPPLDKPRLPDAVGELVS
jgi:hypothetical protein